jgi:hypothetical protein
MSQTALHQLADGRRDLVGVIAVVDLHEVPDHGRLAAQMAQALGFGSVGLLRDQHDGVVRQRERVAQQGDAIADERHAVQRQRLRDAPGHPGQHVVGFVNDDAMGQARLFPMP